MKDRYTIHESILEMAARIRRESGLEAKEGEMKTKEEIDQIVLNLRMLAAYNSDCKPFKDILDGAADTIIDLRDALGWEN